MMLLYASTYILEFSRKTNIMKKENSSMMRCLLNVFVNCWVQLYSKEIFDANFYQKIFQNWLPIKHYNNLFCKASQNSFRETFYSNPLKFRPSRRLVPVRRCNLALFTEFLLFLRPVHNSLRSGFILVFCLTFSWSAGTLYSYTKYFSIKWKSKEK